MKIAAYLDAQGLPASLYDMGSMQVFEDAGRTAEPRWKPLSRYPFGIDRHMSLDALKRSVAALVSDIGADCKVLLSAEIRGLPYSVLQEEHGFRTWKSEGELAQQLDFVCDRETEAQARKKFELVLLNNQPVPAPMLTLGGTPGHYWIDLRAALEHPGNPTSRAILIPFLRAGRFVQLEILCGHLPKWMAWELERLDLAARTEAIDATGDGIRVTVYSRLTPEGRALKPGLLGGDNASASTPCFRERKRLGAPHANVIGAPSSPWRLPAARKA